MAISCDELRDSFARQTPVFEKAFLKDFISDMTAAPYVGRHQSRTWEDGASQRIFDKVHVAQPDYTADWQERVGQGEVDGEEDCETSCKPPTQFVEWGTTRDQSSTEHKTLRSKPLCLDKLRQIPNLNEQMAQIYRVLRKMPIGFIDDFMRTRVVSYHDLLQIAGDDFDTVSLSALNINANASVIDLGGAGNLPESQLTWNILSAYSQELGMKGYEQESGLPSGMYNLLTHPRTYHRLVGLNPELRSQLHTVGVPQLSPLYMPGKGINADPFGPFAPTFDNHQLRYQHAGNGVLNRVLPYLNTAATSGLKPIVNPAYLNARYAISVINHPKAWVLFTQKPSKIHDQIPSVNTSMWGQWKFINPEGVINWVNTDGTECTENNELQWWFYWLCYLQAGFRYEQRDLVMPILHLVDGSGKGCVVNDPVCGDEYPYVAQDYSSDPEMCEDNE